MIGGLALVRGCLPDHGRGGGVGPYPVVCLPQGNVALGGGLHLILLSHLIRWGERDVAVLRVTLQTCDMVGRA